MQNDFFGKALHDIVDRDRRDICQTIKATKNPVMHMYYEGQRVALARMQATVKDYYKLNDE